MVLNPKYKNKFSKVIGRYRNKSIKLFKKTLIFPRRSFTRTVYGVAVDVIQLEIGEDILHIL